VQAAVPADHARRVRRCTDGYAYWAAYAASIGRSADWRAWSEDETCAQKNVASDTEAALSATPYCSL